MPSLFSSSSSNTTNQNGTSTVGTSGASSSTPTFSSGLQSLMDSLQGYSTQSMTNPSAQLAPIQSAGLDQINQQYATAPDTVSAQLASRGYGSSGLMGNSLVKVANAKAGAQSSFNGQLAGDAVQQSQFGANLANSLLNTGKGTSATTSGTSTGTTSSDSNSNSTSTHSILARGNMKARLQEASDAHQAFLTKQVQDNQESSVKDIMNRMNLGTVADPVNNGAIQQPTTSTQVASQMAGPSVQQGVTGGSSINDPMSVTQSPGPSGGPSALPPMQATVPGGAIPVDPSRQQVTYNGRGGSQQYALKSAQQLQTQADLQDLHNRMNKAADSYSTAAAEGQAKNDLQLQGLKNAHAYQLQEEGGGTPAPPEFSAFGYRAKEHTSELQSLRHL